MGVIALPADGYIVVNKTILTSKDRKIITTLYQPIIGYTAVSLYFTLIDDLDKLEFMSEELTHHHLMATMQLRLEDIVIAREKLEAIGLLKTFLKHGNINHYVYNIYSPVSANEFFNHPVLNIVLYNNLGKKEYEKIINLYKIPNVSLKNYDNISKSFSDVFKSVPKEGISINEDITKRDSNNLDIIEKIDIELIKESIPKDLVNPRCFNKDTKELLNSLCYIYNLETVDIINLVRDSLNEKGLIDKVILRKRCRDNYQFENSSKLPTVIYNKQPSYLTKPAGENSKRAKMIYTFENISPYQLLKAKAKGGEPTTRDKRLIENLLIEQKLKPGVVNVLLSYVLSTKNQQLQKSYLETIAGQWKRLNIETVEDAMKVTEAFHKKTKTKKVVSHNVKKASATSNINPKWFDGTNDKVNTNSEEEMEMDELLKTLVS